MKHISITKTFSVARVELIQNLSSVSLSLVLAMLYPFGSLILNTINPAASRYPESHFYVALSSSIALRLLFVIYQESNFIKNRILYIQYNQYEVTIGKILQESFTFFFYSVFFSITYIVFSFPINDFYTWLFVWGAPVLIGATSIFILCVIVIRIIKMTSYGTFAQRALPIIFVAAFWSIAVIVNIVVQANDINAPYMSAGNATGMLNYGRWFEANQHLLYIPILNTLAFVGMSGFENTFLIFIPITANIIVIILAILFVLTPYEKRKMVNIG